MSPKPTVTIFAFAHSRGRVARLRFSKPSAAGTEPCPATSPEVAKAIRAGLAELRRRMARGAA